jgi:hypothetical protein
LVLGEGANIEDDLVAGVQPQLELVAVTASRPDRSPTYASASSVASSGGSADAVEDLGRVLGLAVDEGFAVGAECGVEAERVVGTSRAAHAFGPAYVDDAVADDAVGGDLGGVEAFAGDGLDG